MDYDEATIQQEQFLLEELYEKRMITDKEFFFNEMWDNFCIIPKDKKCVRLEQIIDEAKKYLNTYGYDLNDLLEELTNYN